MANTQITPSPETLDVRDGYLFLSAEWLQVHSNFEISFPMHPIVVRPNPLTMQPVVYITRGPVVYCVEDADHPWEHHHFKVS